MSKTLSHLDNPLKVHYDIEVLPDVFTNLLMTKQKITVMIVADSHYDYITDEKIIGALSYLRDDPDVIDLCEGQPEIEVRRFYESDESHDALMLDLMKFINCKTLWNDLSGYSLTEYYGWNSARYDLTMLIAAFLILQSRKHATGKSKLRPRELRAVSDTLIRYEGPEWLLYDEIESKNGIPTRQMKLFSGYAAYADGHVDLAKIAKTEDGGAESKFPPGLKKEMARYGLDIVIDESVSGESVSALTESEFLDLLRYNANDVLGTGLVGRNLIIRSSIETRDSVRKLYPYTSAKATPLDKVGVWAPAPRDATAANLAGLVLIGERRRKPVDNDAVSYKFPVPSGEVDLLEFMKKNEAFMHPDMYAFFDHFRGKDTRTKRDFWLVSRAQPITHGAMLNVPYYRDGKPTDAYIRVSTGGAHGSVMAGLSKMSEADIRAWIRADTSAVAAEKPTIDLRNVIHIDWSSFYPVMASKMGLYKTVDGVDRYTGIIDHRIKIKDSLPRLKADWTEEHVIMQEQQMGLKFILNNATGAGNMRKKYSLLPVDNKTLSMRLCGNMHIWCLAQRLTQAGAYLIATNTDGIYITGLDLDAVNEVVNDYVELYGMDVEPEVVDRFINRDTSTRVEFEGDEIINANGRLRHGLKMHYTDHAIGRNVPYPLVAAHAALEYMKDPNWLTDPYDRSRLDAIVERLHAESETPEAWYHIQVSSGKKRLFAGDERLGRINRVVMTTDGEQLRYESANKPVKAVLNEIIKYETVEEAVEALGLDPYSPIAGRKLVSVTKDEDGNLHRNDDLRVYKLMLDLSSKLEKGDPAPKSTLPLLGLEDENGKLEQLLFWSPSSLTGYKSDKGEALNTRKSLQDFDMSKLDLKAYTDWAEDLLSGWKVTADIPEIGLKACDDTVVPRSASSRVSGGVKRARALAILEKMYRVES